MQKPNSHPLRWPLSIDAVWLAMPLFVVAIRTLLQPIPMEDYWWHLVMGRLIDAHGTVPSTNIFLYTLATDAPFYNQPWLAQWIMYLIVEHLGHVAMVIVHTMLLVTTWAGLVTLTLRRGASCVAVGVAASLAYYISASTLMPRTQMFAYPLFVALLTVLLALAQGEHSGRWRAGALVVLGVVTAFWANVHGTFVLAPLLTVGVALGWVAEEQRRGRTLDRSMRQLWVAAVAVVVLAMMVSPGGVANFLYPFDILFATKGNTAAVLEWAAPSLSSVPGFFFYAALVGSGAVLWRRREFVTLPELALLAPTTLIALGSMRGILWWSLATVVIVVPHVTALREHTVRDRPGRGERFVNAGLLATLTTLVLLALPGAPLFRAVNPASLFGDGRLGEEGELAVLSELHPAGLTQHLREVEGRIYHHQALGGFLEWTLTTADDPRPVAFVDQRLELVPDKLWDDYFAIGATYGDWRELLAEHRVGAFVVGTPEHAPLSDWLATSPDHELVAQDRMWRLYIARDLIR